MWAVAPKVWETLLYIICQLLFLKKLLWTLIQKKNIQKRCLSIHTEEKKSKDLILVISKNNFSFCLILKPACSSCPRPPEGAVDWILVFGDAGLSLQEREVSLHWYSQSTGPKETISFYLVMIFYMFHLAKYMMVKTELMYITKKKLIYMML